MAEPEPTECVRVLRGHHGPVNAVRFNGIGYSYHALYGGLLINGFAKWVRHSQGQLRHDLRPGQDDSALEPAPRRARDQGRRAARENVPGSSRIRRARRCRVRVSPSPDGYIYAAPADLILLYICSANDNGQFASCGRDKAVFLWDVPTGKVIRKFEGHAHVSH
jgi:WD40 repeat protein